jgi:hypothetical protein
MKKCFIFALLLVFILTLTGPSSAAVKKTVKKTTVVKKVVKPAAPAAAVAKPAAVVKTAQKVEKRSNFAAEGGLGGGSFVIEFAYQRKLTDNLNYSAGVGYGIGNNYGVVVLDVARVSYDMKNFFVGGGLGYNMYSKFVTDIPGMSGKISDKNLVGIELMAGKNFGNIVGKLAYNTALGLRASAGYEF